MAHGRGSALIDLCSLLVLFGMALLWSYPYVIVRIECALCKRAGQYRLARLAERFGANADLLEVLEGLTADCPHKPVPGRRKPKKYVPQCRVRYPDLPPSRPPDLPSALMALRVVKGGKS